jgi:hypothetical protein
MGNTYWPGVPGQLVAADHAWSVASQCVPARFSTSMSAPGLARGAAAVSSAPTEKIIGTIENFIVAGILGG